MFSKIKKMGMDFATSPQAMSMMSNPNVQKALMKALQLPSDVRNAVQARAKAVAEYTDIATRNDVQTFAKTVRELERELNRVKRELEAEKAKAAQRAAAAAPSTGPAMPAAEAAPVADAAPPSDAPKKTKIVTKKKTEAS
ncbi:MAG: hypothetical protein IV100_20120 [Myxococcales bacterium]|nr:hypothetical protein [Myxococcales bacterium]